MVRYCPDPDCRRYQVPLLATKFRSYGKYWAREDDLERKFSVDRNGVMDRR